MLSELSLYGLIYTNKGDNSKPEISSSQSPINYEPIDPGHVCPAHILALDTYDTSYVQEQEVVTSSNTNQKAWESTVPCNKKEDAIACSVTSEHSEPP